MNIFLAEREKGQHRWRTLTFGEAMPQVIRLAQALIHHGLSTERPLMVLSGNSIEHALLACAAMHVGIPYVPVSPSYALLSEDFVKLRHVVKLVTPGMLFVDEEARFNRALAAVCDNDVTCVAKVPTLRALTFDSLAATPTTVAVESAHARVTTDTIAKLLFTSGSTGMPKAVINTHRMLCSNQAMLAKRLSFLEQHTPVLVDWLPWHHTFGGNTILGMAIHNGGALYIDDGNPTAQGVQRTIENLREVSPTFYCNVPKGFEALVEHLRNDDSCARPFSATWKCCTSGRRATRPCAHRPGSVRQADARSRRSHVDGAGLHRSMPGFLHRRAQRHTGLDRKARARHDAEASGDRR